MKDTGGEDLKLMPKTRGTLADFWNRFRKNRMAVVGMVIFLLICFVAILAHVLAPVPFSRVGRDTFKPPGPDYLMGTDNFGRDTFSGVVMGARVSLVVGMVASLTSIIIGTVVGSVSGYYGGRVDDILMRITEFVLVMPPFFMILVMVAIVGPSLRNIILIIGLFSWPRVARVVRSQFLSLKQEEYTVAARAIGVGDRGIIFRHILPNTVSSIIVIGSLQVGQAILNEAGLSFLGLGDPRAISWGRMLNNAQQFLGRSLWMAFFPGLAIFLTVLSVNLVGDGINDALNPKMRR